MVPCPGSVCVCVSTSDFCVVISVPPLRMTVLYSVFRVGRSLPPLSTAAAAALPHLLAVYRIWSRFEYVVCDFLWIVRPMTCKCKCVTILGCSASAVVVTYQIWIIHLSVTAVCDCCLLVLTRDLAVAVAGALGGACPQRIHTNLLCPPEDFCERVTSLPNSLHPHSAVPPRSPQSAVQPATRRIEQANNSFAKNVNKRGKVPVTKVRWVCSFSRSLGLWFATGTHAQCTDLLQASLCRIVGIGTASVPCHMPRKSGTCCAVLFHSHSIRVWHTHSAA